MKELESFVKEEVETLEAKEKLTDKEQGRLAALKEVAVIAKLTITPKQMHSQISIDMVNKVLTKVYKQETDIRDFDTLKMDVSIDCQVGYNGTYLNLTPTNINGEIISEKDYAKRYMFEDMTEDMGYDIMEYYDGYALEVYHANGSAIEMGLDDEFRALIDAKEGFEFSSARTKGYDT